MNDNDFDFDLGHLFDQFQEISALAAQIKQHPRYREVCRIADKGEDLEHPAALLAFHLDNRTGLTPGEWLHEIRENLKDTLEWMQRMQA